MPPTTDTTSTVISRESSTTLTNRMWHVTIKVASRQSSWLTLPLHGSKSDYLITPLCSYQYYMTAGSLSVTKHFRCMQSVGMAHLGMCYRWSTAGSSNIPLLGFRCPYRCTTARWSSWRSCCRHSWESCLSLWGQPRTDTHIDTLVKAVMGH